MATKSTAKTKTAVKETKQVPVNVLAEHCKKGRDKLMQKQKKPKQKKDTVKKKHLQQKEEQIKESCQKKGKAGEKRASQAKKETKLKNN